MQLPSVVGGNSTDIDGNGEAQEHFLPVSKGSKLKTSARFNAPSVGGDDGKDLSRLVHRALSTFVSKTSTIGMKIVTCFFLSFEMYINL